MSTFRSNFPCPLCEGPLPRDIDARPRERYRLECGNCGDHSLTDSAYWSLRGMLTDDLTRARLAYGVRKLPTGTLIGSTLLQALVETSKLPPAIEQIDNLVIHLATSYRPGEQVTLNPFTLRAVIGAVNHSEAMWVIVESKRAGLLDGGPNDDSERLINPVTVWPAALTIRGWQHYTELMRQGAGSRHAFMAMDFNEADIRAFFAQHLQPAVAQTGFELRTTDHPGKTADLIDNRMRVELRTSRFVVCDLSHSNRGAYWEAGFAEGIGRPVFYICRHDAFNSADKHVKPHFDAAHQAIVQWDPADPSPAIEELKAMIRATLPTEAKMEDAPQAS